MKYLVFIIAGLSLLVIIFIFLTNLNSINHRPRVIVNGKYFNAEIAKTESQKTVGLAKYNKINDDLMMVFPFANKGNYTFWMKDMKFSIDIIYIADNKIVDIFKNVPYPKSDYESLLRYTPRSPSDTVLEINAGLSDKYGFEIGDSIKIEY
ncbi:MAG: hypothetical protein A2171_00910 [Candidatus Levybacteria bacterium RBG_13_35_9]|nr:MAG: hypothetical protein A2171_00910 [Candidatus Levybacteria bacterium RBG_13_35_9]